MKVEVLGSVQDGGVPHLGCSCDLCQDARDETGNQRYISSLMLREDDEEDSVRYLVEATPDIRFQIKGDYLDGVFLSQGHLGHSGGLPFFGTEALDASKLTVHCCPGMADFIMKNDPYRLMVDRGQIELEEVKDGDSVGIRGGKVEPRSIDHRHVNTDVTTYMIHGEEKKLYYVSDIDEWTDDTVDSIREADIAIVDGTFWKADEIDRYEEVPHPTIQETMEMMEEFDTEIYFIHMNHTNPVLREDSEERKEVEESGFGIAERGMEFKI